MQTTEGTIFRIGQALRGTSPQGFVLVTILLSAVNKNIFRIKFVNMSGEFGPLEIQ